MTDDDKALVERLRAWEPLVSNGHEVPAAGVSMYEAANRIEAQAADIERLKNSVRFPTSEEEAVAMFMVSESWLRGNAPHLFTASAALGETE
jgi:hypothetical protein